MKDYLARELSADLTAFARDYDPYYVSKEEWSVEALNTYLQIISGDTEGIKDFLREIINENDEDFVSDAKGLLKRLEEY